MRKLPIGTQSFNLVRSRDMAYADKTGVMYRMIKNFRQCFIARPPCFGKSLLLNALESLFSKGTEMFRGLAIEKLWTEKTCMVQHPGFSGIDCSSAEAFERAAVSNCCLRLIMPASLTGKSRNTADAEPSQTFSGKWLSGQKTCPWFSSSTNTTHHSGTACRTGRHPGR